MSFQHCSVGERLFARYRHAMAPPASDRLATGREHILSVAINLFAERGLTKRTQSASACTLRNFPIDSIDNIVIGAIERQVLQPERLEILLAALLDRTDEARCDRMQRLARLRTQRTERQGAVSRLWQSIEAGLALPTDPDLAERMKAHKAMIHALSLEIDTLERQDAMPSRRRITPDVIARFSDLMRSGLRASDANLRKRYLHTLVEEVRLSNDRLTIVGRKTALESAVVNSAHSRMSEVLTFARNWRTPVERLRTNYSKPGHRPRFHQLC